MATIIVGAYGNRYPCTPGYRCIGVHDEAVINAAITAAGSGGMVKLTSGNFNIADNILLTEDVSLRGSVHTVLKFTSPTVYALRLFCYGSTDPDVPQRIMRLRIVGEGTMEITGSNVRVSHCWSEQYGKGDEAFNIASGNGTTQSNIRFDYCVANRTSGSGFVVNFEAVSDTLTTIEDVTFVNCRAIGCGADWTMVTRSGDWESAHWVAGFLLGEAAQGALSVTNNILVIDCVAEGCLESGFYVEPGQAATNCRLHRCISRNNAQKSNYLKLDFDTGSVAPVHGEIVTGATSGATGRLVWWQMHPGGEILPYFSGTWAGSDAAGASVIGEVRGTFVAGETINGSNGCVFKVATDGLSQMVPWFGAGYLLTTGYFVTDCLSDGNARGFHFGISPNNPRPSYPIRVSRCVARNPSGLGVDANNGLGFNFSGGPDEYQLTDVIADDVTIENCGTQRCLLFYYCVSPVATDIQVIEPCGEYVASACTGTPVLTEENELNYLDSLPPGAVALYLPTEEGRNLLNYSQQFDNAAWMKGKITCTANAIAAPDGSTTGDKLVETTEVGTHLIQRNTTLTMGETYTWSIYLKKGSRRYLYVAHLRGQAAVGVWFDVETGTKGSNPANIIASTMEDAGSGWYRCSITFTPAQVTTSLYTYISTAMGVLLSGAGDPTTYPDGFYAWGDQLEVGSYATTYYPTTDKQILKDYANRSRNLLLPNQANAGEDGTTGGFGQIQTATVTSDSTEHWQGSRCIKVVTPNLIGGEGVGSSMSYTAVEPGKTYAASGYIKGSGAVRLKIYGYTEGLAYQSEGASGIVTLTGDWQRVSATFTPTGVVRRSIIGVVTNAQSAATIYIDGLQLEEGLVATEWQAPPNHGVLGSVIGPDTNDPTWTGQGLAFDGVDDYVTLSGFDPVNTARTACSVFVVMKMDTLVPNTAVIGQYDVDGANRGWLIRVLNGDRSKFEVMVSDNGTSTVGHLTEIPTRDPVLTAGTYAFIGFTFDSGNIVQYAGPSPTPPGTPIATGALTIHTPSIPVRIGAAGTVAAYLTGTIAAVMGHSRALSDAEVAQAYVSLRGYLAKFGVMLQ